MIFSDIMAHENCFGVLSLEYYFVHSLSFYLDNEIDVMSEMKWMFVA